MRLVHCHPTHQVTAHCIAAHGISHRNYLHTLRQLAFVSMPDFSPCAAALRFLACAVGTFTRRCDVRTVYRPSVRLLIPALSRMVCTTMTHLPPSGFNSVAPLDGGPWLLFQFGVFALHIIRCTTHAFTYYTTVD